MANEQTEEKPQKPAEEKTESKNTVIIEEAGPCRKKVIIEVPAESITSALDERYGELHRDAVLPGFRKGRAPRRLLEKRYGIEVKQEIKLKLIAAASEEAIKDNELDTLAEPEVDYESLELPETGPLKFDFEVEVRPQFELPQLEGIPVEKPKLEVSDAQIDEQITQLQRQSGTWVSQKDGSAQADDQLIAEVIISGKDIEHEKLEDVELHVRPTGFVSGLPIEKFDEMMIGAKHGDVKKTTVEVSKTHYNEDYRGRTVDLEIKVKDVKRLIPAELNEEFLKRLGLEDAQELRDRVRESLERRTEQQAQAAMTDQIYRYLLDNITFDLPADVVAEQSNQVLQRRYSSLLMRGMTPEQIQEQTEQLRAGSEEQASQQVKLFFIMDKISGQFDIKVSEEEINGRIAQVAMQRGVRPEKMRQDMVRDGSLASFTLQIREEKCISKLLESAKISEAKSPVKTTKKKKPAAKSTKAAPVRKKKTAKKKES